MRAIADVDLLADLADAARAEGFTAIADRIETERRAWWRLLVGKVN